MPDPSPPTTPQDGPWWRGAVFYQIYPRSFRDSDADGVGDLEGIRSQLDHLVWLGVDALWLSPIFPSPGVDGGYDVADYCDIDPVFGDLDAFDHLVADAHARGLRVLLDWVPNHTSAQHPWFRSSRQDPDGPYASWYWWSDEPSNNWQSAFGGPAWTFDRARSQYYLHLFTPDQPDLNWNEPGVRAAMFDVLRFWLDRGVDGFRADVVHLIGRDPALRDIIPRAQPGLNDLVNSYRDPRTHALLADVRKLMDSYPGERVMVGEVSLEETEDVVTYLGTPEQPELHLAFDFSLLETPWDAMAWRACIASAEKAHVPRDTFPTWVLSSHDASRHRSRYGGSEDAARAAAVLLLTLRGTPFVYAGEELGLEDTRVDLALAVDPLGRDASRAPIPWAYATILRDDSDSILQLYRRLIELRKRVPALTHGELELLDSPPETLAYRRSVPHTTGEMVVVVANFGSAPWLVPCEGTVLMRSREREAGSHDSPLLLGQSTAAVISDPTWLGRSQG